MCRIAIAFIDNVGSTFNNGSLDTFLKVFADDGDQPPCARAQAPGRRIVENLAHDDQQHESRCGAPVGQR
jgi:hypothetical protein